MILYLTLVYFFLDLDKNIVDICLRSVAMEKAKRTRVAQMTREVLTGLLEANLSGAILQAVYTWMILDLMGVKCVYLYALTCAFFKTAPFASTWLVGLVASIQLFLQEWKKCLAD